MLALLGAATLVGTASGEQPGEGVPMRFGQSTEFGFDEGWIPPVLIPLESEPDGPDAVVGGHQVDNGEWDDAVGIVFLGQYVGCTGTLVGPKVVISAGHCVTGYPVTHVIVGSKNWALNGGEMIEVEQAIEYPNSQQSFDASVILLKTMSTYEPRPIALECILQDYLEDDAPVQIVGFGVTTESGTGFNSRLNEAPARVVDKNCDEDILNGVFAGCNASVSPGGELAAGGDGTDACYGDSGGPLYLKTDVGDFVVGITSRAFIGVDFNYPCRDGGIWVRPDAIIDWIEEQAGSRKLVYPSCNEAPEPVVADIETWVDTAGATVINVNDPDGDDGDASFEIVVEPEHGTASVDDAGEVTFVPSAGYIGEDTLTVAITDAGSDHQRTGDPVTLEVEIGVLVQAGRPPGGGLLGGCGCAQGSSSGAGSALAALLLLGATRRRR